MAAPNNPRGAKSDKLWRDAIMVAVKRETTGADGKPTKKLALLADKLVNEAINGNVAAIKEIGDRLDGRATQPISGDSERPTLTVVYVDPTKRERSTSCLIGSSVSSSTPQHALD